MLCFFLMIRRTPRATRTDTLFPYTTLFRSLAAAAHDNPLLQAWGAAGREFDAQLFAYDLVQPSTETELYREPPRDTLLHALQADVFARSAPAPLALHPHAQSIQVHACHSRPRAVDVLHDPLDRKDVR